MGRAAALGWTFADFLRPARGRGSLAAVPVTSARDTFALICYRSRSFLLAATCALTLSPGLIGSAEAGSRRLGTGPASETEVLRLSSNIAAAETGEEAGAIESRLSTQLESVFLELSVLPGDASAPSLRIVVTPFADPDNPGYDAGFAVLRGGDVVPGSESVVSCSLCTHGELADKVAEESRRLIALIRAGEVQLAPEPEGPEPEPVSDGPTGVPEPVNQDPQPAGLGPLAFIGIGASALGVGSVGGGAFLLAKGDEWIDNGLQQKRRQAPGGALLGVGVGVLATGVVLIVVDRMRAKKAAKP